MRIGIFDPYLDDLGGGEKYMMTIAECLSANHQVDVFWDKKHDLDILLQRFSLDLSKVKIVKNIFAPKSSRIQRLIETKKYDVIIILSDGSIPLVLSKRLYVHIQQPLSNMQSKSVVNKLKLARVNTFFTNSEYTQLFISNKFALNSKVINPPVDLNKKDIKKENIILHVGRFRVKNVEGIDDYKKQSVMINAFKDMIDEGFMGWKLIIAASLKKEDQASFNKMINIPKEYPIEFLVNKNNDELWDVYSKAKIYWHASGYGEDLINHPEYAEHFGISTVEAMGAGAVPVVINAGGQKEIVTDGENGYLWDTTGELKFKTLKLTKNSKLMDKLSQSAIKASKKYSLETFYSRINELILS